MGPDRTQVAGVDRVNSDFQNKVLEQLGRLEAKVNMIVGNGQPGRMKLAEDRLVLLERNDLRRAVYDRLLTAGISVAISAAIAWRERLGLR
ncbi:MAG: hypothetical protein ABSG02_20365 [Terriglobales bacterium]|jgi:predicted nicotinamide N-methyase